MTDSTAPAPPSKLDAPLPIRKPLAAAISVLATVIGLLVLVWGVLYVTKGRFLRPTFETAAGRLTNREVRVGGDFQLYFAPFQLKFLAERISVSNPAWASKPQLFTADRIDSRIAPLSLIAGKRRFYRLDLTNAAIDLEWDRAHRTNTWTFSEKKGKPMDFPRIDVARVKGTTLRYRDPRMRLLADLNVDDITSTAARIGRAVGVQGGGRLRDTPFRVEARLLSPDATANRGQNRLEATAWAADNVIDVTGTLPSIADIENVPLQTRARGRNMADLLGIIGVTLPDTRDYRVRAQLVKDGEDYRFTRLAGTFGRSDLAGRLTVTNGARLHLDSHLATRTLDIVDAAPFIGYNPDIVAQKGAVAAAAATGAAPQRVLPDARFPIASMQVFDADLKWTIRTIRSKSVPISDVDLTLDLNRGRLALSPLSFAMARGNVASDVIFDTRQRPTAASYDIRVAPTPLSRLLAGWGVEEAGTTGTVKGRIQLNGRGDTIHDTLSTARGRLAFILPKGSFWTRNVQLAELDIGTFVQKMFEDKLKKPVEINCGLIAFSVRDGIAAADPILIDTTKNVMIGRGGFSFRNETLDLAFRADSKKFSVFAGQSPVGVNGYFSKPGIDAISPQLLSRAGAGLGLALVATPVAGVLAFVDVGDAKSAACGPILAGATAQGQRTTEGKARDDVGRGTTAKSEDGKRSAKSGEGQRKKFLGIF